MNGDFPGYAGWAAVNMQIDSVYLAFAGGVAVWLLWLWLAYTRWPRLKRVVPATAVILFLALCGYAVLMRALA